MIFLNNIIASKYSPSILYQVCRVRALRIPSTAGARSGCTSLPSKALGSGPTVVSELAVPLGRAPARDRAASPVSYCIGILYASNVLPGAQLCRAPLCVVQAVTPSLDPALGKLYHALCRHAPRSSHRWCVVLHPVSQTSPNVIDISIGVVRGIVAMRVIDEVDRRRVWRRRARPPTL